ncbi:hypothetical protein [Halobaculum roseum]|uniref:Halobacterial output domain-containing protein n=1 Tax=Halobaculum roseum TaxID=2175149 RepID=A0ABD5MVX7_9EURY|nr:hypothetical protein [Halobaculum roseum]QZY04458.1 hypothetical protein K6T36_17445 [Halobaculum roseum]
MSEQLVLLFARLGIDPDSQPSVLHDSVETDALNALAGAPTTTVSFALWGHWVRITPDVIEVYAPATEFSSDTGVEEPRT